MWQSLWRGLHREGVNARGENSRVGAHDVIKSPAMEIVGKCLTADEFIEYVEAMDVPEPRPTQVFLHHTWKPTVDSWKGMDTILAMKAYYERQLWQDTDDQWYEGWTVGPHIFVAPDGIWLFSDLRYDGVGVYGHNYRTRHVEMVGNYDNALPSGAILENSIIALGILSERFGLSVTDLGFHRDFSTKTCPGLTVQKAWIIPQVTAWVAEYREERKEKLSAVRRTITEQVQHLLVRPDPNGSLTQAAGERGMVGPLSDEIPFEVDGEAYLLQYYAAAMLVPADGTLEPMTLGEYEDYKQFEGRNAKKAADENGTEDEVDEDVVFGDLPASPCDPFPVDSPGSGIKGQTKDEDA